MFNILLQLSDADGTMPSNFESLANQVHDRKVISKLSPKEAHPTRRSKIVSRVVAARTSCSGSKNMYFIMKTLLIKTLLKKKTPLRQ